MKLSSVLAIFALLSVFVLTACGTGAVNSKDEKQSKAEDRGQEAPIAMAPAATAPPTRGMIAIRSVKVQQYENRLPSDSAVPLPSVITLVQFEIEVCEPDLSDADFTVHPELNGGFARAYVVAKRKLGKCPSPRPETFTASTPGFAMGSAIAVANPLLVERLGPAE